MNNEEESKNENDANIVRGGAQSIANVEMVENPVGNNVEMAAQPLDQTNVIQLNSEQLNNMDCFKPGQNSNLQNGL